MFTKINEIIIPKTYIAEDGEDNEPLLKILTIAKYWGSVVGNEIDKNTNITSVKNDTIFVNAASSVWAAHLTAMKSDILKKLNSALYGQKIKDIRFTSKTPAKKIAKENAIKESTQNIHLTEEEMQSIKEISACIKDQALRKSLEALLMKDKLLKKNA